MDAVGFRDSKRPIDFGMCGCRCVAGSCLTWSSCPLQLLCAQCSQSGLLLQPAWWETGSPWPWGTHVVESGAVAPREQTLGIQNRRSEEQRKEIMIHLKEASRDRKPVWWTRCFGGGKSSCSHFLSHTRGWLLPLCWGMGPTPSSTGRQAGIVSGLQKWLSRNNTSTFSPKSLEHFHPCDVIFSPPTSPGSS